MELIDGFEDAKEHGRYAVEDGGSFRSDGAYSFDWVEGFGGIDDAGAVRPCCKVAEDETEAAVSRSAPTIDENIGGLKERLHTSQPSAADNVERAHRRIHQHVAICQAHTLTDVSACEQAL